MRAICSRAPVMVAFIRKVRVDSHSVRSQGERDRAERNRWSGKASMLAWREKPSPYAVGGWVGSIRRLQDRTFRSHSSWSVRKPGSMCTRRSGRDRVEANCRLWPRLGTGRRGEILILARWLGHSAVRTRAARLPAQRCVVFVQQAESSDALSNSRNRLLEC